jgi:hypothetical protein
VKRLYICVLEQSGYVWVSFSIYVTMAHFSSSFLFAICIVVWLVMYGLYIVVTEFI